MQTECKETARDVFSKGPTGFSKWPSSDLHIWLFGFLMKIHAHFAKWKIYILHVFCVNLCCNSNFSWRFCVPLPHPAQGKQSFHSRRGWDCNKPCWVSLGTQTDRRECVSPIFSMTPASCGLQFEEREVSDSI